MRCVVRKDGLMWFVGRVEGADVVPLARVRRIFVRAGAELTTEGSENAYILCGRMELSGGADMSHSFALFEYGEDGRPPFDCECDDCMDVQLLRPQELGGGFAGYKPLMREAQKAAELARYLRERGES